MQTAPHPAEPVEIDAQNLPVRQVAAAVIVAPSGLVLLTRRPEDRHLGGYWEFPGGKLEAGETGPEALVRELNEEIGIRLPPALCQGLISRTFDYPHLRVRLTFFRITLATLPTIRNLAVVDHAWVRPEDLPDYRLPPANVDLLPQIMAGLTAEAAGAR